MTNTHRYDIQILRGIAVLLVVLYHLQISFFKNGFLGVDIFFVISGYLMAQLYNQGSIRSFYVRRIKRIFPSYLLTISITTFVVAYIASPVDFIQRFDRVWYDLLGISNIAFWLQSSYFDDQNFRPLLNLWSLGVEFQYYLIVPFLLDFLRKKKFLLLTTILVSIVATFFITTISTKTSFFMMPLRIWEFLIGAYIAWTYINFNNKYLIFVPILSLTILISVIFFFPLNIYSDSFVYGHVGIASLMIALLTGIILLYPFPSRILSNKNLFTNLLTKLGDYSYSIYLIHFPVIVMFNYQPFSGTILGSDSISKTILMLLTTGVFSILIHKYVELARYKNNFNKFFYTILIFSTILIIGSKFISNWKYQNQQSEVKLIFNAYLDQDSFRCGTKFRVLNPLKPICLINDFKSNKKVLLLGDSHANSLKPIFVDTMRLYKITHYFYASNDPLMKPKYNAKKIYKDILKFNITDVIFHYNTNFYKTSNYYKELDELLLHLKSKKINVFFISPVPVYKENIPEILYNEITSEKPIIKRETLLKHLQDNKAFFDFIGDKPTTYSKVYSSGKLLCPTSLNCLLELDGKPLYFDSNHLTITGAKTIGPIFVQISEEIIKK